MKTIYSFLLLFMLLPFGAQSQSIMTAEKALPTLKAGKNRVTFPSAGEQIVGTLFLPDGYQADVQLPVVIVSGPWTQVKEQVGYHYAEALRQRGLAALAIDHRYWGESGGQPRSLESGTAKVEDLRNAITFLSELPAINPDNINLVGVCAGAGITARVAALDDRLAGYATIAAWLQHPTTTPMFYGGEEGVAKLVAMAEAAQEAYATTGEMSYVAAYDPTEGSGAAMSFPSEYYGQEIRGAVPTWTNKFAVAGWKEWLGLNAIDGIAEHISAPTLMIHSDQSALPNNVRKFYDQVTAPKQLIWTVGAHTDFYDQDVQVGFAADKLAGFFLKAGK